MPFPVAELSAYFSGDVIPTSCYQISNHFPKEGSIVYLILQMGKLKRRGEVTSQGHPQDRGRNENGIQVSRVPVRWFFLQAILHLSCTHKNVQAICCDTSHFPLQKRTGAAHLGIVSANENFGFKWADEVWTLRRSGFERVAAAGQPLGSCLLALLFLPAQEAFACNVLSWKKSSSHLATNDVHVYPCQPLPFQQTGERPCRNQLYQGHLSSISLNLFPK